MNTSTKKIVLACILGFMLIATALYINYFHKKPEQNTISTVEAIRVNNREYITIYDSDNNGIPDWQETLVSSNPLRIASSSDTTYTAPDSLTGQFGIQFFKEMLLAHNYGVLGNSGDALVDEAVKSLARENRDMLYTNSDISLYEDTSRQTLHDYGDQIALIILTHPMNGESEAILFRRAVEKNNANLLTQLSPIHKAYAEMTQQMLTMNVPQSYAQKHLNLLNAYNAITKDIEAMESAFEDPLQALLRFKRYEDDVIGMGNALTQLYDALYLEDNVRWEAGEPTLQLVQFKQ